MGAPAEILERARAAMGVASDNLFEVWPENWPAVNLWLACSTQWQYAGMNGVRVGLSYPGVDTVLNRGAYLHEGELRPFSDNANDTFLRLQTMERAALEHWADERARQA